MSVSTPSIKNANLTMVLNPSEVVPITQPSMVNLPVTFSGQTFVKTASGTYTPANDFNNFLTLPPNVTMLLLIVDAFANLDMNAAAILEDLPVNRVFFTTMAPFGLSSLRFDGRASGLPAYAVPMAQGSPVNWFAAWSDGTIA